MSHTIIARLTKTGKPAQIHSATLLGNGRWEVYFTPAASIPHRGSKEYEYFTAAEFRTFMKGIAEWLEQQKGWPKGKKAKRVDTRLAVVYFKPV